MGPSVGTGQHSAGTSSLKFGDRHEMNTVLAVESLVWSAYLLSFWEHLIAQTGTWCMPTAFLVACISRKMSMCLLIQSLSNRAVFPWPPIADTMSQQVKAQQALLSYQHFSSAISCLLLWCEWSCSLYFSWSLFLQVKCYYPMLEFQLASSSHSSDTFLSTWG